MNNEKRPRHNEYIEDGEIPSTSRGNGRRWSGSPHGPTPMEIAEERSRDMIRKAEAVEGHHVPRHR